MTRLRNAAAAFAALVLFVACASSGAAFQQAPSGTANGIALYQQGQYAEAAAALRGQGGAEANAYLAASLAKQKQYGEAVTAASAALGEAPTHPVAVAALGEALVGQKLYDDAVARLSEVLAKDNQVAFAYYWRGQAHGHKKQTDRMVSDYEYFVRLAPDTPEAHNVRQLLSGLR